MVCASNTCISQPEGFLWLQEDSDHVQGRLRYQGIRIILNNPQSINVEQALLGNVPVSSALDGAALYSPIAGTQLDRASVTPSCNPLSNILLLAFFSFLSHFLHPLQMSSLCPTQSMLREPSQTRLFPVQPLGSPLSIPGYNSCSFFSSPFVSLPYLLVSLWHTMLEPFKDRFDWHSWNSSKLGTLPPNTAQIFVEILLNS